MLLQSRGTLETVEYHAPGLQILKETRRSHVDPTLKIFCSCEEMQKNLRVQVTDLCFVQELGSKASVHVLETSPTREAMHYGSPCCSLELTMLPPHLPLFLPLGVTTAVALNDSTGPAAGLLLLLLVLLLLLLLLLLSR